MPGWINNERMVCFLEISMIVAQCNFRKHVSGWICLVRTCFWDDRQEPLKEDFDSDEKDPITRKKALQDLWMEIVWCRVGRKNQTQRYGVEGGWRLWDRGTKIYWREKTSWLGKVQMCLMQSIKWLGLKVSPWPFRWLVACNATSEHAHTKMPSNLNSWLRINWNQPMPWLSVF